MYMVRCRPALLVWVINCRLNFKEDSLSLSVSVSSLALPEVFLIRVRSGQEDVWYVGERERKREMKREGSRSVPVNMDICICIN